MGASGICGEVLRNGCDLMKKTDKKTEKSIIEALTAVCETALDEVPGFQWLTHSVNYNNFPKSLSVICVFDTRQALSDAFNNRQNDYLRQLIKEQLSVINIQLKDPRHQVSFDTEEACQNENGGRWKERFNV